MLNIVQLPVLKDNYIYILHEPISKETAVVDPALAEPVLEFLIHRQWSLNYILNTHHHWDHIGGNTELKQHTNCQIMASVYDQQRIPGVDAAVSEGAHFYLGDQRVTIIDTPGHTLGHIAYYVPESHALFCGDTLFGMGCGRLFEGSAEQLWSSLQKFKALPQNTLVYCAHEYTQNNGDFALTLEPDNLDLQARLTNVRKRRQANLSTVPASIADELATNPFLRTNSIALQNQLAMPGQSEIAIFTRIRQLKDVY